MDKKNMQRISVLARYVNGNHRVEIYSDGTRIRSTGHWEDIGYGNRRWVDDDQDHFTYAFPESFDLKVTDYCDGGCAYCHENSTVKGRHGDLSALDHIVDTIHPGTEIAIGGGNALACPGLLAFLRKLKDKGIIANITVNQKHVREWTGSMMQLTQEGLVHGIGISLTDSSAKDDFRFIDQLGQNVVIHVIAGILTDKDVDALIGRKVLILGYKDLRRGHELLGRTGDEIRRNIEWLRGYLPSLSNLCRCLSFDCLGLEQLDPKTALGTSDKDFAQLFQGSDTDVRDADGNIACGTMYIDLPNMQVARMSTASLDRRYSFTGKESISELLELSTRGW